MTPASGRSECVHATCAGDVVAVGDGRVGGITQDFTLQEGDTILYSKFGIGATDISVQGDLHVLIREDDVIGTLPRSGATAADVPELKPLADRVLLKVKMPLAINAVTYVLTQLPPTFPCCTPLPGCMQEGCRCTLPKGRELKLLERVCMHAHALRASRQEHAEAQQQWGTQAHDLVLLRSCRSRMRQSRRWAASCCPRLPERSRSRGPWSAWAPASARRTAPARRPP